MKEFQLHDLLIANPNLIEDGLTLLGREVPIGSYRCDLLFEDIYKRKLYVEVKLKANDKVAGQIMRYRSLTLNQDARYMVVALTFLHGLKEGLLLHGYEYKELLVNEYVHTQLNKLENEMGINIIAKSKLTKGEAKYKSPEEIINHFELKSLHMANVTRAIFDYVNNLDGTYYYMSDGIMFVRKGRNNKFLSISSVQGRVLFHFPIAERDHIFEEYRHFCAIYMPKDARDKNQIDIKLVDINSLNDIKELIILAYDKRQ